jgi:hypothetical protein
VVQLCHNGIVKQRGKAMLSNIALLSLIASAIVVVCMRASGVYDCKSWIAFGVLLWVCVVIAWLGVIVLVSL